ncbi:MAG: quinone-dependent dihydroorotate dehydrogenase [Candidatus Methylacidiphilales bacterium]
MYSLARNILFRFDAESVHHLALHVLAHTPLARWVGPTEAAVTDPVEVCGLTFRNRVGLAAGMDKDGLAVGAWRDLGFGFVELGTVTRWPQAGNARPRIFRCPREQGLINRMGFPNSGAKALADRLARLRVNRKGFPVGINLGKTKIVALEEAAEDYVESFQILYEAGDFFVVNVSSPNTPGLRSLQAKEHLKPIVSRLQAENRVRANKPLLVKIAPDLTEAEISEVLEVVADVGLAGVVATNTTLDHASVRLREQGGLSGLPLRNRSTEVVRYIAKETSGKLPIIGVGGIFTRKDYLEKLEAGAWLVEVYTGFVYEGPGFVGRLVGGPSR